jgi:hypothetical protein
MNLSRRQILKGISLGAGSLVLGPVMQQVRAQAAGTAGRARRFVFVVEGNGLPWQQVTPATIGRGKEKDRTKLVDLPLDEYALPTALEPVAPWKDRLTIVNGLSGKIAGGGHSNDFGALGAYNCAGGVGHSGTPRAETIDVALGKRLGGIFKQVGLGISPRPEHTVIYNCSAWDAGKPMPTQCRPDLAYGALFGSVAEGSAKADFVARTNVLDFLRDDIRRLESNVSGREREKLQAHLAAYESMRERQSRLNEIESTLREQAPVAGDKFTSDVETDRLDAHFDIAAAALVGGLTNVVTIASGAGNPYFGMKFTGLGIDFGKHGIGHGGSYKGMTWDVMAVKIRRFHFELIARLMKKLESVPEGDGTMLDHTTILYLSDAAEGHHSRCWEWPMVMLGNAGGALNAGGRYVEYPYWGQPGHHTIANFYTTLLHAVGDRRELFGLGDPVLEKDFDQTGPLPELLA